MYSTRTNGAAPLHVGYNLTLRAILAVAYFLLPVSPVAAQVQCLIPENNQNGLLTFENVCDVDIVMEFTIGNQNFSNHMCFSNRPEYYPCQYTIRAGRMLGIDIPVGALMGAYRACYRSDLGKPVCEFNKKP